MKSTEDSAVETAATEFDHCGLQRLAFFRAECSLLALTIDATLVHPLANSVGYLPGGIRASQLFFLRLRWSSKFKSLSVTSCLGLRSGRMELLCPRLTSANSSRHLSMPVVRDKLTDPPRVMRSHLPSFVPPHTRTSFPYRYWTLSLLALSSSLHASYAISVRRASVLPAASFSFHLAMDTLAVRLTIPPVGFVGDFHSLVRAPCRAHQKESPRQSRGLFLR